MASLCKNQKVITHYQGIVREKMVDFSSPEQVKKFLLIPAEFTQEQGELTPTLKLKRRVVLERNATQIDGMYA